MAVSVAFKSNKTCVQKDVAIPHGEFHLGERVGQLAEARIPLLASGWRTGNRGKLSNSCSVVLLFL